MVNVAHVPERLLWQGPAPLWPRPDGRRPAVLRFATDAFVEELQRVLGDEEKDLGALVAVPETWRDAAPVTLPDPGPARRPEELTLFQPVHGRFYLVAASLVCRRPGFPDKAPAPGTRSGFVLRRLVPTTPGARPDVDDATTFSEFGRTVAGTWLAATSVAPVADETVYPLAPVAFTRAGRRRRMLTGLIPVAGREQLLGPTPATGADDAGDDVLADPRYALVLSMVLEPLRDALERCNELGSTRPEAELGEALVLAAIDLADALHHHTDADVDDVDVLGQELLGELTWADAVADVDDHRDEVLAGGDLGVALYTAVRGTDDEPRPASTVAAAIDRLRGGGAPGEVSTWLLATQLRTLLQAHPVVAVESATTGTAATTAATASTATAAERAWYAIRCVHHDDACTRPRPEWTSALSEPFHLASFHDPDAPARDLSIPLPFSTSPRDLRRFPRNVRVHLSAQLRKQMARVRDVSSLENGDLAAPSIGVGMVCSLSIPIITICALILLMVVVSLLNIVFWWLPFFKICLPVPEADA